MQVITAKAGEVYRGGSIPEGIDTEREIPIELTFELDDLTPKKGYVLTPTDELFRKTVERLRIPIHKIRLVLPRSGGLPFFGSRPLEFFAEESDELHHVERERLRPFALYERNPYRGGTIFDSLDTGESKLEQVLDDIKRRPVGETLTFGFDRVKMILHTGYNDDESAVKSMIAYDRVSASKHEFRVETDVAWLPESTQPELKIRKDKSEEIIAVASRILESYMDHFNL